MGIYHGNTYMSDTTYMSDATYMSGNVTNPTGFDTTFKKAFSASYSISSADSVLVCAVCKAIVNIEPLKIMPFLDLI